MTEKKEKAFLNINIMKEMIIQIHQNIRFFMV
jgi:hypothetical protein